MLLHIDKIVRFPNVKFFLAISDEKTVKEASKIANISQPYSYYLISILKKSGIITTRLDQRNLKIDFTKQGKQLIKELRLLNHNISK